MTLSAWLPVATVAQSPDSSDRVDFNRDIRPLLSDNCFHCHGPDKETRKAKLRLDTQAGAHKDLGGYAAVTPRNLEDSELWIRLIAEDKDDLMPPPKSGKKLTPQQIALFKKWIEQGGDYSQPWAYVPPIKHPTPKISKPQLVNNFIDHFILARLEREKIQPSPLADKVTLIRRLSFDLTGLPPTADEVRAFVGDKSPKAYEKVVDRLLASPHYGERMAMWWLDLVRFADTVGYHGDQDHRIWPYRDYVINAFNKNLPFDQFTKEQLAGDLLPNPTQAQRVATGYNRLLQTSHEGGVQPKEYLAIYAADRVRNVSGVWMGATVGCAQCHDHKYDPYTAHDFYAMAAVFADVDEAQHFKRGSNSLPTNRPPEMPVYSDAQRKQLKVLDANLAKLANEAKSANGPRAQSLKKQIAAKKKQRAAIVKAAPLTMVTQAIKPRVIRLLPRGNWLDDTGPVMAPAIPEFMGKVETNGKRFSRLDMANWLTRPASDGGVGGLTARVQVNRFWHLLFGSAFSSVLDDFGGQGEPPTHPKFLDRLAVELVESGWDVKHMLKTIVMSRTYQQSSLTQATLAERDPKNRLYARQSRPRLQAEMIRDNALAISGLLVPQIGGASVKPYQPAGYYQHLNFPERRYKHHADDRQWRRGVYVHWQRQFLHPMLKAFDAPSREECTAERPISNTPSAALTLLNDPTFVEAARSFATRIMKEGGKSDQARLQWAFTTATSRSASPQELRLLASLLADHRGAFKAVPKAAAALMRVGQAKVASSAIEELAAWTSVARAILNLNELITRN